MDIEKLIEQLRTESLYADKASLEIMDLCMDAATALSTLQAENDQLRDSRDRWKKCAEDFSAGVTQRDKEEERILAENEKLRAELDGLRIQWDMYGGDVGITAVYKELEQAKRCIEIVEKQRDAAIKELENYMVQDVLDGNEPCKICAKASDIPCEYCNPKWRGPQKED